MHIAVVGAGPAGLAFATLRKRRHPQDRIVVHEQNPPGATFGFGVVFSDTALEFLGAMDPATRALLTPAMETWTDITLVQGGRRIAIDGVGFSAIGRRALLDLMRARALAAGVELRESAPVSDLAALGPAHLVVGADGLNSRVRAADETAFGPRIEYSTNHFAWFGTAQRFETLTQTFVAAPEGAFNAHHYRFSPDMSTFIVECDAETFTRNRFADLDEARSAAVCARIFAAALGGLPLVASRSMWRRFPHLSCARWHAGNRVLIGDAAHTAHFSIGSGTRLAIEDAIALADALDAEPASVPAALALYEKTRRPMVEKLVVAARRSADWYDDFASHMRLPPADFALAYIQRTGRIDPDRLARMAPRFAATLAAERAR
jgi:2-polyprenyl-6-methoxyphenol hydroxylase-like FAD-dependent oxidoreductase